MSENTFKAQAQRLAAYLAGVHGIKIKNSSTLEAVAAMHGARDWNSLVGASKAKGQPSGYAPDWSRVFGQSDWAKSAYAQALFAELTLVTATRLVLQPLCKLQRAWQLCYEAPKGQVERQMNEQRALEVLAFFVGMAKMSLREPGRTGQFSLSEPRGAVSGIVQLEERTGHLRVEMCIAPELSLVLGGA